MSFGAHSRDDGSAAAGSALVDGFLANQPEAIGVVASWARQVARHKAWGFESPEDIVQATLLALVTGFRDQRFTGGNLRAYVQRIAKNMCVSSYRRAVVRRSTVSVEVEPEAAKVAARVECDPERDLAVREIMRRLDEACRRIIDLAYVRGHDRREIAQRLGINVGAARVKLFRCLETARAMARE